MWDHAIKLKAQIEDARTNDGCIAKPSASSSRMSLCVLSGTPRAASVVRGGSPPGSSERSPEYIEQHVTEHISLATLAQLVRLSSYHFCRSFKQSFGMPPHRYHTQRRMERAKLLLAKPAVSVTDVGMAIGFSETSSFTSAFRKATGLTPTGYQRSVA